MPSAAIRVTCCPGAFVSLLAYDTRSCIKHGTRGLLQRIACHTHLSIELISNSESRAAVCYGQVEDHAVDGKTMRLLVHRKGATRAFPPHHPLIPIDYQFIGQPVLIGGSMGTCSYVLTGEPCCWSEKSIFLPQLHECMSSAAPYFTLYCTSPPLCSA